jgi:catechol 2,3-dioxygenase-like lactoylglutathione lyase family enzyme
MQAADLYHVGAVVDDLDAATNFLAKTAGYRWCEEMRVDNKLVCPEGETIVPLRFTYSMDEPHVELIQSIPGTIFSPASSGSHHLGFWSDDIDADLGVLEAEGATIVGRGFWLDGGGPLWAFATPQIGPRIELVHSSSKPSMERWFATGTWGR